MSDPSDKGSSDKDSGDTDSGPEATCYSMRREDPSAEGSWRDVGLSPPGHLFVTNETLYCMADEMARHSPYGWNGVQLFCEGRRFAYGLLFDDVGGREALCVGLLVHTSYDGSWPTGCRLFAYRLVSTSGLLHGGHFGHLRFRRSLFSESWNQELERAWGYLGTAEEKLRQFGVRAAQLKGRAINSTDLADLRRGPLAGWPTPLWGQVLDQHLGGTSRTAWDLLTAGTTLLWNDGERPPVASDFRHNEALTEALMGSIPGPSGQRVTPLG